MAASRTISIRLTVAEADQFKQAFAQAGAAGTAAMATITKATTATSAALQAHTQTGQLANYQLIELAESAHKFADGILSGGSALKAFAYEAPNFVAIAGGMKNALSAVGTALPLLAIGAAVAGIYELGKSADEQQSRLRLLGQQVRATRDDYDAYAVTLDKTARSLAQHSTLSTKDARDTVNAIGTNPNFSGNATDLTRLATDAANLSIVLKTDLAGGTKVVTDGLNDAAKAAKELGEKGIKGFTPPLVQSIALLQQGGKYAEAFALFLKTAEARSSEAAEAGLTPLGAALKRLNESLISSKDGAKAWSEELGGFFDALAARAINAIAQVNEGVGQLTKAMAAPVAVNTNAATTPDATGRGVLLGQPIPGRDEVAHGIMQVLPSTAAGFHLNPDIQDQNILAGLEDLQQKIAKIGSVDGGLAAYGGASSPDKAAAYTSAVHKQNIANLPADVSSQIDYWGQILGLPPDLISLGKQIALQESGGHQYASPGQRGFSAAASQPTIPAAPSSYRRQDWDASDTQPPSTSMVNGDRKSAEDIAKEIEGTRAVIAQSLAVELAKIEEQLQQLRTSGRQGSVEYAGLQQREHDTQGAIYRNVDPQTQMTREGQNQLDSARLARRYGFTPADEALSAQDAKRQENARQTGYPVTQAITDADHAQAYQKATMELTRLEDTQKRATAGSESLAQAYLKGGTAVADYTAKNQALEQINSILPETAANYRTELDKLTDSYRKLAQGAADAAAAQRVAADTKATSLAAQQDMLIRSGVGPDQQTITMAGLAAKQQSSDASQTYQDAAVSAAKRQAQTDLALQNTKANYSELTNFASNSFDKIGSDMTQAFTQGATAAKSFGDIGKAVISDLSQELIKLSVINPIKNAVLGNNSSLPTISGIGGVLGSLLGNSGNSNATNAALAALGGVDGPATASEVSAAQGAITNGTGGGLFSGIGNFFSSLFHEGGIVGQGWGSGTRMVDPSVFYTAPRLHNGGLAGDEYPAVLQAGEGVFTKGQMDALGMAAGGGNGQGGGDTHLHLNINAQGAGPREIDALRNQIPGMALAAVQNASVRGGKFTAQVRGRQTS